jgi:hypothetical protein
MQLSLVSAMLAAALVAAQVIERYTQASVDQSGRVRVTTDDGRLLSPVPEDDQVEAGQPKIAPDHRSVGWVALYANCCTSYPLPLKVVILHNGRRHVLEGLASIWYWDFQDGGKVVAAREELPHGGQGLHYDRWDVVTGRRVADYTPEYDSNGHTIGRPREPKWVRELDAAQAEYYLKRKTQ